ncbi:MAG: hypothetical protein P8Y53_12340, partial [Pseudolabrys sp.]
MSEHAPSVEGTAPQETPSATVRWLTDIIQALLLICVVGWVLDLPRRLLNMSFYTEQMLAICLGLALALIFIAGKKNRPPNWFGWAAAALSILICCYIALRYSEITFKIYSLPTDLVVGAAILDLLVLEATRRSAGGVLVVIILVISAYVFIGPHMPGNFATLPVSLPRLTT